MFGHFELVLYAVESEIGVLLSMLKKVFVNALINTNTLLQHDLLIKMFKKCTCLNSITTGCVVIKL